MTWIQKKRQRERTNFSVSSCYSLQSLPGEEPGGVSSGEEQAGIHLPGCCYLGREPGCAAEASLSPSFQHSRGGLYLQSPTGEGLAPTEQEMLKGSQTSHVKRDLIAPEPKVDSSPQLSLVSTALVRHQQGNRTRCMQVTPKLLQQS